jgi:hypothetical protein
MAQYPQGIFQSLQWLMKKVKILALQKEPTYIIDLTNAPYTMPGRGIYFISSASNSNQITFPNPEFCNGESITVFNEGGQSQSINTSINCPKELDGSNFSSAFDSASYYEFKSINGNWLTTSYRNI